MNIEISDEMIEQMVKEQVEERVKAWFTQDKYKYIIKDFVYQAVTKELNSCKYLEVFQDEARKLTNKIVLDGVCARISSDIAEAFAEKYGY